MRRTISIRVWWLVVALGVIGVLVIVSLFMQPRLASQPDLFLAPNPQARVESTAAAMAQATAAAPAAGAPSPREASVPSQETTGDVRRIILRNANLNLIVTDTEAKIAEITTMTQEMGGWVVDSSTRQSTSSTGEPLVYGSISVRVPAERLDEALERITADVVEVTSRNVSGQDVTQQYVDISSRLKNLEEAETQMQAIMDTANRVEDVLAVYRELVRLRGDIESLRGQIQYFGQAAAFSLIQVNLSPELPGPVQAQATGWSPGRTVENAFSSLIGLVQGAVDLALSALIVLGIPAVIVGIPAWWLYRRVRRARPQT